VIPSRRKMHAIQVAFDKQEGPVVWKSVPRRANLKEEDSEMLHSPEWVVGDEPRILCELHDLFGVSESQCTTGMVLWNVGALPKDPEALAPVYRGATSERNNITGEKMCPVDLKLGNALQQSSTHFFVVGRKTRIHGEMSEGPEDQVMVMKYPIHVDPTLANYDSYVWEPSQRFPRPDVLMLSAHGEYPEKRVSMSQIDVCCASGRLVVAPPVGLDAAKKVVQQSSEVSMAGVDGDDMRSSSSRAFGADDDDDDEFGEGSWGYHDGDSEDEFGDDDFFDGGGGPCEIRIVDFLPSAEQ
jgi:hypothetical protein